METRSGPVEGVEVAASRRSGPESPLRDTFAAAALTGLLAGRGIIWDAAPSRAYALADAMLAVREGR